LSDCKSDLGWEEAAYYGSVSCNTASRGDCDGRKSSPARLRLLARKIVFLDHCSLEGSRLRVLPTTAPPPFAMHANRSCAPSLRSVPCAAAAKAPTRKDATGRGAMVSAACYSVERIMSGGGGSVGHSPREQSCGFGRLCMLQSRGNHGRRRRRPQPSGTATALSSALCAMAAAAKATSPLGRPRGAGRLWGWRRWRTR